MRFEAETEKTLSATARDFGAIPAQVLVDHLRWATEGGDMAVQEAAFAALERRWRARARDELSVAKRPPRGRVLGTYATRGSAGGRPYESVLLSLHPLRASCDCPDFTRSSLGLCKHLLTVLDEIHASKQRLGVAQREPVPDPPALDWDPRLALGGGLDRIAGLRFTRAQGKLARDVGVVDGAIAAAVRDDTKKRRDSLAALKSALGKKALDATPAARALVAEELERAARRLRQAEDAREQLKHLRTLRRKLYRFQRDGVERFLRAGRLLLADDMGLGKTTQAVAACHALHAAGRVKRGLVIAPASLKSQWLREWQACTSVPVAIVDGGPAERARRYRELDDGFLVLGYEQLIRDIEQVLRLDVQMVVLDEAQRIKNYATKSATYVKALTPAYRLVLTGTPLENRLEELASILDWVDDTALAPKWRLVPWYTLWSEDGSERAGVRNLRTLRTRLAPCVLRRVRREVLDQLPSRTDTRVPVEMTPQQRLEHDELNQPIAQLVSRARTRPLTQPEFLRLMALLTRQRMISNGLGQVRFEQMWPAYADARPDASLLEGLLSPKLVELRRLIGDLVLGQERKVVVFSQWRRMLRLAEWSLRDLLGDAGLRAVFFTGAERTSQRDRNIVAFHDDPRVRVMLLSDAGGTGLNLQRAASACINLELPWNPAVLEQRIGRIYRLGQSRPIDVFTLQTEEGIESRIADAVAQKRALFSGLFDGTSDAVRFETTASFLEHVERLVDPALPPAPRRVPTADDDLGAADTEDEIVIADDLPPTKRSATFTAPIAAPVLVAHEDAGALFRSVRVERTEDGGIRLEAPPEAAASLAAMFDTMAKLFLSASRES